MRSAGSTRQVRNLVLVVKWSKNHATGIPSITGDPNNKSVKVSIGIGTLGCWDFLNFALVWYKKKKGNTKLSNSERKTVLLASFIPD